MSIEYHDIATPSVPTICIGDGDVIIATYTIPDTGVRMYFAPLPTAMLPAGMDRAVPSVELGKTGKYDPPTDTVAHLVFFSRESMEAVIKDMTTAMNLVWPV